MISEFTKRILSALVAVAIVISALPLVAGFEAHVVNVTAKIENRPCVPLGFDFDGSGNPIVAGQVLDNEYSNLGLTISANNHHAGMADLAVAFDSSTTTAGAEDLGTPNEDFGGTGIGNGGGSGEDGENSRKHNNLLIMPMHFVDDDSDGHADEPVPEPFGGSFIFTFDFPVTIESADFIDVDDRDGAVRFFDSANTLISTFPLSKNGDNSYSHLEMNVSGVSKMVVVIEDTIGIDNLCFERDEIEEPEEPLSCTVENRDYWSNNEGCIAGEGTSVWQDEIAELSSSFSGALTKIAQNGNMCLYLAEPNCPSNEIKQGAICRAKGHTLVTELNVVSGKLNKDALIALAYDGDYIFGELGLTSTSTIEEALRVIEETIMDSSATKEKISRTIHILELINIFYKDENPIAPQCIMSEDDLNIVPDLNASVENMIETFDITIEAVEGEGENNASTTGEVLGASSSPQTHTDEEPKETGTTDETKEEEKVPKEEIEDKEVQDAPEATAEEEKKEESAEDNVEEEAEKPEETEKEKPEEEQSEDVPATEIVL